MINLSKKITNQCYYNLFKSFLEIAWNKVNLPHTWSRLDESLCQGLLAGVQFSRWPWARLAFCSRHTWGPSWGCNLPRSRCSFLSLRKNKSSHLTHHYWNWFVWKKSLTWANQCLLCLLPKIKKYTRTWSGPLSKDTDYWKPWLSFSNNRMVWCNMALWAFKARLNMRYY